MKISLDETIARIESFASLKDGWYNGEGATFDPVKLAFVCRRIKSLWPECLYGASVFPTVEGNLLFEWDSQGDVSLDVDITTWNGYFHKTAYPYDVEQEFHLTIAENWKAMFTLAVKEMCRTGTVAYPKMNLSIKLPLHRENGLDDKLLRGTSEDYFVERMRQKHIVAKAESPTAHSNFEPEWYGSSKPKHYTPVPINSEVEGVA